MQKKDLVVGEAYSVRGEVWDWTVRVSRNLNDWEVIEYQEMLLLLSQIKLGNHNDKRV